MEKKSEKNEQKHQIVKEQDQIYSTEIRENK